MMEIVELRIKVRKLERVTLENNFAGVGTLRILAAVVVHTAVTDRLLVSEEGVRVLGMGR